jgi:hypothetical protein
MLKSGQNRAALVAALWIVLVLALFAGVNTGLVATVWNAVLIVTAVLTGKWAADWIRWRRDRGAGR